MAQTTPFRARDILGPRPRWRPIPPQGLTARPFSAIASLRVHVKRPSGLQAAFTGTGWFAGPSTVVTAAHVLDVSRVWTSDALSWHVEVVPALGFGTRPFGTLWPVRLERHPSWDGVPASSFDIARLHVDPPVPAERCLRAGGREGAPPSHVRVAGYPFVEDHGDTPIEGDGAVGAVEGALLFYDVDADDGQSGGPVLDEEAAPGTVVAIHSGGTGHGASPLARSLNTGLVLRDELVQWIDRPWT
jgi:glutamyl endopeptidase